MLEIHSFWLIASSENLSLRIRGCSERELLDSESACEVVWFVLVFSILNMLQWMLL